MHPHGWRLRTTVAITLIATFVLAAPAAADDFTYSSLVCTPANGKTLRAGEDIGCLLTLINGSPDHIQDVTATVPVPAATTFDPAHPDNDAAIPSPAPPAPAALLTFPVTELGLFVPFVPKTTGFRLRIRDDGSVQPGDAVQTVATVSSPGRPDEVVTGNVLTVTPPPAVLQPSTLSCADETGGRLAPGDVIGCQMHLANEVLKEDAVDVDVQASILPGTSWEPGGNENSHNNANVYWNDVGAPAGLVSGDPPVGPLRWRFRLGPAILGRTTLIATAFVTYMNAGSGEPGAHILYANPLVVDPLPANLSASRLDCGDLNGGVLVPGDFVQCVLTVDNAAGYEDAEDVTATAPVPPFTRWFQGGTSHTDEAFEFGPTALGALPSGTSKELPYRLLVEPGTEAGASFQPTAVVRGRSVPSGTPVSHAVTAARLVVSRPPSAAAPVAAASPAATPKPAATTPAKDPRICGSRRVVVVNVKPPTGARWKSVTFTWKGARKATKGKKAPGSRGRRGYFRARLVFQGLPKGTLKVSITGRTTKGRTVKRSRTYRLCTPKGR